MTDPELEVARADQRETEAEIARHVDRLQAINDALESGLIDHLRATTERRSARAMVPPSLVRDVTARLTSLRSGAWKRGGR